MGTLIFIIIILAFVAARHTKSPPNPEGGAR